ncbi:methylmalonic aciduria and homocystinuria type C protein homolog [Pecten maximus]|uniref:methylmalonic aciduria and homocystinuria type C protein homolog n=1 Tax=Pecten maximus TaxID=6579 RepID=UPI00145890EF|nr:methylmalonic aciduria and homocystinuria type C protein homolog [Pecten maximus]
MTMATDLNAKTIVEIVKNLLDNVGFEVHPFKLGWYNECVDKPFVLPYDSDTLALLVISTPHMYDKAFRPFICRQQCDGVRDPIDQCVAHHFKLVKEKFPDTEVEAVHDFELNHNRRPKILVQTAGHVAGAAFYYHRKDVVPDHWDVKQKIFGVSVHPKYGGWFALRGVLIFKAITCPELVQTTPPDVIPDRDTRIELLERFNMHWQDWTYRDIIPVTEKYSEQQKEYFATKPGERQAIVQTIKESVDSVTE